MQNKNAIIVAVGSLAVAIVVLAALRLWPENSARQADKALSNAIDQADKYLQVGQNLLANVTSEYDRKDGSVDRGPWTGKDLPVLMDPTLFATGPKMTDAKRQEQEAKWKKLIDAGQVPYRVVMAPTVNPKAMAALAAAQKQIDEALKAYPNGTPKIVALAHEKAGTVSLLTGRALAMQAELSATQVRQQLTEASARLDSIAGSQANADFFRKAKDEIAKGVNPQFNEDSKTQQEKLKKDREALDAEAAQLRQLAKAAQDKGDQLRKESDAEKILGLSGTGQGAAETTVKATAGRSAGASRPAQSPTTSRETAQNTTPRMRRSPSG
ncbi:MAG: hypothetical protein NT031_13985 [Planctomycetota bacterium]|nr:hypothetical protein [Planctomycetota bacterium]